MGNKLTRKKVIYRKALETSALQGPIFKVKNTMIRGYGFLLDTMRCLIEDYESGKNISDSRFIKWGINKIRAGVWFYGCKTEDQVHERQRRVLELYEFIKVNGYDPVAALDWDQRYSLVTFPISVRFDEDGFIYVCDGFHRLTILHILGIEVDVDCIITNSPQALDTTRTEISKGDFPLDLVLQDINSGKNLYQPNNDPRCKNWTLWRQDCEERLALITYLLDEKTVPRPTLLDIGSSEGYFPRQFSKMGYDVTGLEVDKRRIAVSRYLATKQNQNIEWVLDDWRQFLQSPRTWNVILMLSVWHHAALENLEMALISLEHFRGKCDKLVIETVLDSERISWTTEEQKKLFNFSTTSFTHYLEKATQMRVTKIVPDFIHRGYFILLEK